MNINFSFFPGSKNIAHCEKSRNFTINFGAKDLYDVYVKDTKKDISIKCHFAEIDTQNDKRLMNNLFCLWRNRTQLGGFIKSWYKLNRGRFFVLYKNEKLRVFNVLSIARIEEQDKTIRLCEIQASPEIADKRSSLHGAGANVMLSLAKLAKDENCDNIRLYSINNGFYENIGMHKKPNDCQGNVISAVFELKNDKFDDFIDGIEKKYSNHKEK